MAGVRVVTLSSSTSSHFLRERGIRHSQVASIGEALEQLQESEVDAVVYDRPVLQYLISKDPGSELMVLGHSLLRENYGFALRPESPLREEINRLLLQHTQSDSYRRLVSRYLGEQNRGARCKWVASALHDVLSFEGDGIAVDSSIPDFGSGDALDSSSGWGGSALGDSGWALRTQIAQALRVALLAVPRAAAETKTKHR